VKPFPTALIVISLLTDVAVYAGSTILKNVSSASEIS
jgi:hypothetical protein